MTIRRYKHVRTSETVEEEITPRKGQRRIVVVPHQPPAEAPQPFRPVTVAPQSLRLPKLAPLALKPLTLASLAGLSLLTLTMLTCAFVGLMMWPDPSRSVPVAHGPVVMRNQLTPLTPTSVAVAAAQGIAATPLPTAPAAAPIATPIPPPTPVPSTSNQSNSRPTLTSRVVLNVRAGPGVENAVVGKLAVGQSVPIIGQNAAGTWWQIAYPAASGGQAWVSANPQYGSVGTTGQQLIAQATLPPRIAATRLPAPTPVSLNVPSAPLNSSGGWSFAATRADAIPARKLIMLFGEMINETGAAQQVSSVTGTFYDTQGQVIAADKSTYGLWPTNTIPPGGRVPFALTVYDMQEMGNFELAVQSKPAETIPRQDFEFVGVSEQMKGSNYCLAGGLKNPGGQLAKYLVIAAILYDDQGNVLRFGNNNRVAFQEMMGDKTQDFEICIKSPPGNMARHELLAWGI